MSTMFFKEDEIIQLCKVDAEIINKALSVSESLGIAAIKNCSWSYHSILLSLKGQLVPSMDLDYRTYIINLLKFSTEQAINEENKAIIFGKIIMPSQKEEN